MTTPKLRVYESETIDGRTNLVAAPSLEVAMEFSLTGRARLLTIERACAIMVKSLFIPVIGVPKRTGDGASSADFGA